MMCLAKWGYVKPMLRSIAEVVMMYCSRLPTNCTLLCGDVGDFPSPDCLSYFIPGLSTFRVSLVEMSARFMSSLASFFTFVIAASCLFTSFFLIAAPLGFFACFCLPVAATSLFRPWFLVVFCLTFPAIALQSIFRSRAAIELIYGFYFLALGTFFHLFHLNLTNRTAPSKFAICCLDSWHLLRASSQVMRAF